jgi:hypothetical protein
MKKLTSGKETSDIDRMFGSVKLLQAQSVGDSCYDAQSSDKPSDVIKSSGVINPNDFALSEGFIAPYTPSRSSTSESATLLSVILLGAAVVCFWRAAA